MNDEQAWTYFERLADPELSAEERVRLEAMIAGNAKLSARFEAFQALRAWPEVAPALAEEAARGRFMDALRKDREEELVAVNLSKLFPLFMGGAVAAVLLLGLMNMQLFGDFANGTLEALFGIPAETIETAIVSQL